MSLPLLPVNLLILPPYYRLMPYSLHYFVVCCLLQIMLAYSGGNHYDSVYSADYMKDIAFCQGKVNHNFHLAVLFTVGIVM